jgi:flagellar export protein FliJ
MALTPERLKRLVRHREQLERAQQLCLAEAQRRRVQRAAVLAASVSGRAAFLDSGPVVGTVDWSVLAAGEAYILRLNRDIAAQAAALHHSDGEVEAERVQLLQRRRDVKAMEALLERRVEEERLQRNRLDSKRLDELGGIRWLRRDGIAAGQPHQSGGQ